MEAVWQLVEETLRKECRVQAPLSPTTHLRRDLGLDSMALLTLAVAAEDHFHIHLEEDPESPPQTLGDFVALVEQRLREKST
jgi:acyl carrier protein